MRNSFMKLSTLVLAGLFLMAAVAVAQAPAADAASQPAAVNSVLIGPGDLLEIAVFDTPELSGKLRVSEKGGVTLPLIGELQLAGLTTSQAETLVRNQLVDGDFLKDPQVSVLIDEYATQGVSVMGEVQKPGIYPMLGAKRLFDVISMASGLTPTAGTVVTITHRETPQQPQTLAFRDATGEVATANVELAPGDTVVVQRAGIVYVIGDVGKPGGFVIDRDQLTVMQSLALAMGVNRTASLKGARLIHRTSQGAQETPLRLDQIMSAKAPDVEVKPGDIVFVPTSAAKSAFKRSLDAIVQTAVGVTIYGAR